jgi:hypothetical protein
MIISQQVLSYYGFENPQTETSAISILLMMTYIFLLQHHGRIMLKNIKDKSITDIIKIDILQIIIYLYIVISLMFFSNKFHIKNLHSSSFLTFILLLVLAISDTFFIKEKYILLISLSIQLLSYMIFYQSNIQCSYDTSTKTMYLNKSNIRKNGDILVNLNGVNLVYNVNNQSLSIKAEINPELHYGLIYNNQNQDIMKYIESCLQWNESIDTTMTIKYNINDTIENLMKIYKPIIDVYIKSRYDTLLRFGVKAEDPSELTGYRLIDLYVLKYNANDVETYEKVRTKMSKIVSWPLGKFKSLNEYIEYLYTSVNNKTIKYEDIKTFTDVLSYAILDYHLYNYVTNNTIQTYNKPTKISEEQWGKSGNYIDKIHKLISFDIDTSNIQVKIV